MMPLFVSFYTPEYADEAAALRATCEQFHVVSHIEPRDSLGSWQANCCMKPHFIREMIARYNAPVVWVDADARVKSEPVLFKSFVLDYDFAAFFIPNVFPQPARRPWGPNLGPEAIASGTVYFNRTPEALLLLDGWAEQCKLRPNRWDQQSMQAAWPHVPSLRTAMLPQRYCKVFDCRWYPGETGPPIIEHTQASRRLRRRVQCAQPAHE